MGAGFGGLELVKGLADAPVDVVLVDANNFHTFQPLLYQVATAGLDSDDIAAPVRGIVQSLHNVDVRLGKVVDIDFEDRRLLLDDGPAVPYDRLVLAAGAVTNTFGVPGVDEHGFGLKSLEDSLRLRQHLLRQFERASVDPSLVEQGALDVIIAGGGPTGVSVADNLARRGNASVHLFHGGAEPLPGYHPKARRWIAGQLRSDGVTVHPEHRAALHDGFRGDELTTGPIMWSTGQAPFEADLTLWAVGGVRPHSAFLPPDVLDEAGFVRVDPHLRVVGHPEVFAVGDVAASDPNRSSARNWGYRIVVANVRAATGRRRTRLRTFSAPDHRWGSVLGVQDDGMVIVQPDGKRVRVPRWAADRLLMRGFVPWYLYGGLRGTARSRPSAEVR